MSSWIVGAKLADIAKSKLNLDRASARYCDHDADEDGVDFDKSGSW